MRIVRDYPVPELVPVAVDGVEVGTAVVGAALGVDGLVEVGAAGAGAGDAAVGLLPRKPLGTPVPVGDGGRGQSVVAGQRGDVGGDAGVDPRLAGQDVRRVGRQPGAQLEPGGLGEGAEPLQRGPRPLGVHVVGRERGDAAPVVDAGGEQHPALIEVDEVGGRLQSDLGAEHDPRDGQGGGVLVQREVVDVAHGRVGLGPEVLDDHLLHVAVLPGHASQREDRLGPLGERLADADEEAGGEGDREAPCVLEHPQAYVGVLVRRAEVRQAPGLEQTARSGLEHHAHRRGDRLEPVQLLPRHHAGVQVRQQPGLLQHSDGHRAHVGERGVVALLIEPLLRLRPAVLGPVTEGEQRLEAAHLGTLSRDLEDLVGREVRRPSLARRVAGRLHEGAVVAPVAAQAGDRDEDLGGVGDRPGSSGVEEPGVPDPPGDPGQPVQVIPACGQEHLGLGEVEGGSPLGARQGAAYLLGSGGHALDHACRSQGRIRPPTP